MAGTKVKALARGATSTRARTRRRRSRTRLAILAGGVVALVAVSFVLPTILRGGSGPGITDGTGLPARAAVPAFAERDLVSGRPITSESLRDRRTLLFFSEGVMCQACFQQIQGLEAIGSELERRGIDLVSITPDPPSDLRRAMRQYAIRSPMISDADRDMSAAFNTLGRGMHPDTPGHAFVLIEDGEVRWYRDYWLAPDRTMFVEPRRLLSDIPTG